MINLRLIPILVLALLFCGCYSENRRSDRPEKVAKDKEFIKSGICYMRAEEDYWRAQSAAKMRETRKIPSVDFEFDSIILERSAYDTLDKLAEIMVSNRRFKLIVEGHTDTVGTHDYNDWLSSARANAVKAYLVSRDVYADSITTYGLGKRRPLVNDDSPDGRACNRRVVFTLTVRPWAMVY